LRRQEREREVEQFIVDDVISFQRELPSTLDQKLGRMPEGQSKEARTMAETVEFAGSCPFVEKLIELKTAVCSMKAMRRGFIA